MREFYVTNPCHNFFEHVEPMRELFTPMHCHNFFKYVEPMPEFFATNLLAQTAILLDIHLALITTIKNATYLRGFPM